MMPWNSSDATSAMNKANELVITKSEITMEQGNFSNFLS